LNDALEKNTTLTTLELGSIILTIQS